MKIRQIKKRGNVGRYEGREEEKEEEEIVKYE